MNPARSLLFKGAIKSAVSAATGLIIGLPIADAEHFNPVTLGGWKHIGLVILITVVAAEARFWKQWADSSDKP
jgi:steroid 5-alpha reductase family enzyme